MSVISVTADITLFAALSRLCRYMQLPFYSDRNVDFLYTSVLSCTCLVTQSTDLFGCLTVAHQRAQFQFASNFFSIAYSVL